MTTFQNPLKVGDAPVGNSQLETVGFVKQVKVVSLGGGATAPRAIVTLPPKSTLINLAACPTSAFDADVSAVNVSWGNSSQATRYGVIAVSALGAVRAAAVSAATDFDAGGTIVLVASAVSTTTFTNGGVRAFIEYVVTE